MAAGVASLIDSVGYSTGAPGVPAAVGGLTSLVDLIGYGTGAGSATIHGDIVALASGAIASATGGITEEGEPPAQVLPPVIFGTDDWPRPLELIEPPAPLRGRIRAKAAPATAKLRGRVRNPLLEEITDEEAVALVLLLTE